MLFLSLWIKGACHLSAQSDFSQLNQQFLTYRESEKEDSALLMAKKMNQLALKEQSDTSYWYALSLRYIGNYYDTKGVIDSVLYYWTKSLKLFETHYAQTDDHATTLNKFGYFFKKQGLYTTAEDYYLRAAAIRRRNGPNNKDYAKTLNNISYLYNEMAKYEEALTLVDSSIAIFNSLYANDSLKCILEYASKAEILLNMNDFEGSEKLYLFCISACDKHPDTNMVSRKPTYQLNYCRLLIEQDKIDKADTILKQLHSMLLLRPKNNKENLLFAEVNYWLGRVMSRRGKINEAIAYYQDAYRIKQSILGDVHPDIAEILNSLGIMHFRVDNFESAQKYYEEALKIRKESLGEKHPDYAKSLNTIAGIYSVFGDYKQQEACIKKALEIRKNALGEHNIGYAINLNSLARYYRTTGQYKKAEECYKKTLEIKREIFKTENHDFIATSYTGLGSLYLLMGAYNEADSCLSKALRIRNLNTKRNEDYAATLYYLGMLYFYTEEYSKADKYLSEAINLQKTLYGETHNDLIDYELAHTRLLFKTNRGERASSKLDTIFRKKMDLITSNFEWLSDNQKETYWNQVQPFYDAIYEMSVDNVGAHSVLAGLSYNAALISKSKLLETKIASENYYREIDELREKMLSNKRILIKMESEGIENTNDLTRLKREIDSLDKCLLKSWPEYAEQKKNLSITWDQVQQHLEEGEAAIEFVRYKKKDDSLFYYLAVVLKKGETYPELIELCKEEELEKMNSNTSFGSYYGLIWQPLETVLKGVNTIYYSPAGLLNNVPFQAIYAPKGKGDEVTQAKTDKRGVVIQEEKTSTEQNAEYLMDKYTLHQLTSTRYLAMRLKEKEKEQIGKSIAMIGGVNYDYSPINRRIKKPIKEQKPQKRSSQHSAGKLAFLSGTLEEVTHIMDTISQRNWKHELFDLNTATEENLMRLEGKHAKSILHIATHGYAFPEFNFEDTTISTNSLRYSYRYSTNPMVRSGLILAGGNWAWTGSDTLTTLGAEQNGILTALEVSQLNLKNTKLVVLSACETGLGKIEGSEGTFGLKRGFKLAGVEQLIVSLWSVPDKETMELMTLFYSDLTKTLNPVSSFSKAQKEMRNKYPTDPEKWAGFVLVR